MVRQAPSVSSSRTGHLDLPATDLLAWAGLAVVNAGFIAARPLPNAGLRVRALTHLFDAGQLLFLGLVAAGTAVLWTRFAPRRVPAVAALSLLALVLAFLFLSSDLENFALRIAGRERADALRILSLFALAQAVPLAHLVGRRMARPRLRWLAVALALTAAILNPLILPVDYPGLHALVSWTAATLAAAALVGLRAPFTLRVAPRRVVLGVLALVAVATVALEPVNAVRVELTRLDSAILAAHVPPWRAPVDDSQYRHIPIAPELAPWFASRADEPEVAASEPPLLPPDAIVLFFTLDSMRAEVLQNPRNRALLPTLHRWRDAGFYVPRAISPSTVTRFTLASLFTGLEVPQLNWARDSATQGSLVKEERPRVADLLTARGVTTVHVISQFELVNHVNKIGRGFSEEIEVPLQPGDRLAYAPAVMDAILVRLQQHRDGPLFLFSHFMDAHHPFDSGDRRGHAYERHVSELANIDHEFARLDAWLTEAGLWPRTLVIVSADHGQAFGQHGVKHHGGPPYEEQCRVPLVAVGPTVAARTSPCDLPLLDLSPTLLDLFGVAAPGPFIGRSLVPALRGEPPLCGRPVLSTTWDVFALLLPEGLKIIDNRRKRTLEVYDLQVDPRETQNLCDGDPAGCDQRIGLLRRYLELHGAIAAPR
ncbi:sulfatase-like hydrolase/transferase [Nannocystis radixulma]|uniref:Sulfatase-like hydrolase/transferase n=1 Tax=Nannocystis radixulma TaxID=2995305 RepID=A0ABT5BJ84_9BACT|nr:sulfatase-like hydrolase/transferase [Nannocystis radixulma]MDC0673589.1 sulfatase-like hydrolase/transferase [Nannocystis radixulma]